MDVSANAFENSCGEGSKGGGGWKWRKQGGVFENSCGNGERRRGSNGRVVRTPPALFGMVEGGGGERGEVGQKGGCFRQCF